MSKRRKVTAAGAADVTAKAVGGTVGTVFKVIGTILLILILSMLLFACIFAYYVKTTLTPSIDLTLSQFTLNQSSSILYQDAAGNWKQLTALSGSEKRIWVDYAKIPKNMEHAVVSIEDKRFYTHHGVDWYRTTGAFFNMFLGMRSDFGGSTITQQLIKNLTGKSDITVQRKLLEIFQALELEKKYSKEDIMEWYLNAVYFGEGSYGVQAAAQTYFGKSVDQLDLAECAAIAGITNLPTYYDPFYSTDNNKKRQEEILLQMYKQGYITKDEYDTAKAEKLKFVHSEKEGYTQQIYTYYEEAVISDVTKDLMDNMGISESNAIKLLYNGGYKIYSCLDTSVQAKVDAVYTDLSALAQGELQPHRTAAGKRDRGHGSHGRQHRRPLRRHRQKDHQLRTEPGHRHKAPARLLHQAHRRLRPRGGIRADNALHPRSRRVQLRHPPFGHQLVSEELRRRQLRHHHHRGRSSPLAEHGLGPDPG
jgi:membrane peptidoglycan carboxypeptidase